MAGVRGRFVVIATTTAMALTLPGCSLRERACNDGEHAVKSRRVARWVLGTSIALLFGYTKSLSVGDYYYVVRTVK